MRSHYVMNRMCDVMLALGEAELCDVKPTKIQLQKFIYLMDVLGQVIGLMKLLQVHKTYFYGPYDAGIQNAVDSLSFRELVHIAGVWRTASGNQVTSYALAPAGRVFLDRLRTAPDLSRKVKIASLVGVELKARGWKRIVDLVYAEPTFVATRPIGMGSQLVAEDGLTVSAAFVFAIMRRATAPLVEAGHRVSPDWLANRFFAFLDDYDRNYGSAKATQRSAK